MQLDDDFLRIIEQTVQEVETSTSAELVVVATPMAGRYLDVCLIGGAICAYLALGALIFMPLVFNPVTVMLLVALVLILVTWFLARSPKLLRWLVPFPRRRREVVRRLHQEFTAQQVGATPERNGLLVLVCLLENQVAVLPDHGLDRHHPRARWHEIFASLQPGRDSVEQLAHALRQAGTLLGATFPKHAADQDDLPDRPRIVP